MTETRTNDFYYQIRIAIVMANEQPVSKGDPT